MKALSIRQPWAELIVLGLKDVENRSWKTSIRGRIYVHAAIKWDDKAISWILSHGIVVDKDLDLLSPSAVTRGAIIGEVDIVDCVQSSKSPWFTGPWGFLLANPIKYNKPIKCQGRLRFFEPKIAEIREIP